jgi:purine-nucleoside phosphorylase
VSLAIIAGSGLGELRRVMQVERTVPFREIPGVGSATVAGHAGEILSGSIDGRDCQLVVGRRHFYEGDARPIECLVDHLAERGANLLLVTSAAGSLRRWLRAGDLVVIHDLIDRQNRRLFSKSTPAHPAAVLRTRGITIDREATRAFERAATEARVAWQRGTTVCTSGPLYETIADVEAFQYTDADVATMSGAPEVTRANQLGLPVVAVAVVTNPCTGIDAAVPSHEAVLEAGARASLALGLAIRQFISGL